MPLIIDLPHVGESVVEGIIGKWLKQPGEAVRKYDPLVEVVTDKVTMEVPSPVSGVIARLLVEEGETVPMGAPIMEIDTDETPEPVPPAPVEAAAPEPTRPAASTTLAIWSKTSSWWVPQAAVWWTTRPVCRLIVLTMQTGDGGGTHQRSVVMAQEHNIDLTRVSPERAWEGVSPART